MKPFLIETDRGTFEAQLVEEPEGKFNARLRQVSGPKLSSEEWQKVVASLVADLIGIGCDVTDWRSPDKHESDGE